MFGDNDNNSGSTLDPWPVIIECLFELSSYEIPKIIGKSGIAVVWDLTKSENYSHDYRKAAYRPRINSVYQSLSKDDRLRVAFIVSKELVQRDLGEKLNENLENIGWGTRGGKLTPSNKTVQELFFPPGSQHDAYVQIRKIIHRANTSLRVIDPYLDGTIFTILGDVQKPMRIDLLTSKVPSDFTHEAKIFQQQHQQMQIETRRSKDFHDRFIIIDEQECWHLGCSIKDAGKKGFMISLLEDQQNSNSLLDALNNSWAGAKGGEAYV